MLLSEARHMFSGVNLHGKCNVIKINRNTFDTTEYLAFLSRPNVFGTSD